MAEEDTYKGRTLEELQQMDLDELSQIMGKRARRRIRRGLSEEHQKLLHTLREKDTARTHLRDMIILPEMVGKTVQVYSGNAFVDVTVSINMIGHYLGEFAPSRKQVKHSSPGMGATRSSKYVPLK